MQVTDIQEFDKKRKKVYIDYEYAFALYNTELKHYGIEIGSIIDEPVYEELCQIMTKRVKARTLYILKSSQKTQKQVYDKLIEGGYSPSMAEIGIEYAKSFGYIDDSYYAEYFVENSCNGRSRRDIENRLRQRGIPQDTIEKVMADCDVDESESVWTALKKKSVTKDNIGELDFSTKQKLYTYLARKGYSSEIIRDVLRADW